MKDGIWVDWGSGKGRTRQEAEKAAAKNAYEKHCTGNNCSDCSMLFLTACGPVSIEMDNLLISVSWP